MGERQQCEWGFESLCLQERMKPEGQYPVGDCFACGAKDIPFGVLLIKIEGGEYSALTYCLKCHQPVKNLKAKGYVSLQDLEDAGWASEL